MSEIMEVIEVKEVENKTKPGKHKVALIKGRKYPDHLSKQIGEIISKAGFYEIEWEQNGKFTNISSAKSIQPPPTQQSYRDSQATQYGICASCAINATASIVGAFIATGRLDSKFEAGDSEDESSINEVSSEHQITQLVHSVFHEFLHGINDAFAAKEIQPTKPGPQGETTNADA